MTTAVDVEARMQQVYRLHLQGKSQREIARAVGCGEVTVYRDLHRARQFYRVKHLSRFDPYTLVSETCFVLTQVRSQAMEMAWTTVDPGARLQALKLVAEMSLRMIWLYQEIGGLPKNLGTVRVADQPGAGLPPVAALPLAPVPGGKLTTDDVIGRYETVFGPFAEDERRMLQALDERARPVEILARPVATTDGQRTVAVGGQDPRLPDS